MVVTEGRTDLDALSEIDPDVFGLEIFVDRRLTAFAAHAAMFLAAKPGHEAHGLCAFLSFSEIRCIHRSKSTGSNSSFRRSRINAEFCAGS